MHSFVTHRAKWIRFVDSCFDRVVFNVIVSACNTQGAIPTVLRGFYWQNFDPISVGKAQSGNPKGVPNIKSE